MNSGFKPPTLMSNSKNIPTGNSIGIPGNVNKTTNAQGKWKLAITNHDLFAK